MNNIEDVVNSATRTWKNIYCLHKPSDFPVQVEEEEIQIDNLEKEEKDVTEEGLKCRRLKNLTLKRLQQR